MTSAAIIIRYSKKCQLGPFDLKDTLLIIGCPECESMKMDVDGELRIFHDASIEIDGKISCSDCGCMMNEVLLSDENRKDQVD